MAQIAVALFGELECWFHFLPFPLRCVLLARWIQILVCFFVSDRTYCNGRATAQNKVTTISCVDLYKTTPRGAPTEKASVVGSWRPACGTAKQPRNPNIESRNKLELPNQGKLETLSHSLKRAHDRFGHSTFLFRLLFRFSCFEIRIFCVPSISAGKAALRSQAQSDSPKSAIRRAPRQSDGSMPGQCPSHPVWS